jgi:biotin carboxyl carrier protein
LGDEVRYHVTVAGTTIEVEIDDAGVRVDGDPAAVEGPEVASPGRYSFFLDGAAHTVLAERSSSSHWDLQLRGRRYHAEVVDDRTKSLQDVSPAVSAATGPAPIRAPMPGLVVRVEVKEGDLVEAGGGLLVVEAMKMENSLAAPVGGRIGVIHVDVGQTIEKDEILMEMLPLVEASEAKVEPEPVIEEYTL